MTLKYESELLYELMKRDGDDTPSDVLPYESELKEKYLNQVVGAYPKLQDYRPEWLNYNLYHHLPSDFPTESVTGVTNATFQNVVPYAYKSAILKGNTLVNLCTSKTSTNITPNNGLRVENIKSSTKYLIIFDYVVKNSESSIIIQSYMDRTWVENTYFPKGLGDKVKFMVKSNSESNAFRITNPSNSDVNITLDNIMVIEYQDGMENWDIPYFEGMQSVKLPVLKATGKNLFDLELTQGTHGYGVTGIKPDFNGSNTRVTNLTGTYIKVNPNTKITFSILNNIDFAIAELDINGYSLGDTGWVGYATIKPNHTITTKEKTSYIGFNFRKFDNSNITVQEVLDSNPMLEISGTATTYEPYKSNILTVNEDVELGSVGEVKDELNLLTGQLTQRTETRAYQEGDESNSEVITDMANTRYKLPKESIKTVDLSDNHVYSYKGTTHYDCSSAEGSLVPTLSIDVPTNLPAVVARQRVTIQELEKENVALKNEIEETANSSANGDLELMSSQFELDFRLFEIEMNLDMPMMAMMRGVKSMAMTVYQQAKTLILAGKYGREGMEYKLNRYKAAGRITVEEYEELIALMDARELVD